MSTPRPGEPGYVGRAELLIAPLAPVPEIQRAVHMLSRRKGWYDSEPRNIPEMIALIHSEASEALEEWRNQGERENWTHYYNHGSSKPEGFGIELADIVIRVLDLAEYLGIDLMTMIRYKHGYNRLRPYRHGGKHA